MRVGGDNSDSKEESSWEGGVGQVDTFFKLLSVFQGQPFKSFKSLPIHPTFISYFAPGIV